MVKHDPEGDDLPSELDEEEDEGGRAEEALLGIGAERSNGASMGPAGAAGEAEGADEPGGAGGSPESPLTPSVMVADVGAASQSSAAPEAAVKANTLNRCIAKFIDILIALLLARLPGYIGFCAGLLYIGIADGVMGGRSVGKKIAGLRVYSKKTGQESGLPRLHTEELHDRRLLHLLAYPVRRLGRRDTWPWFRTPANHRQSRGHEAWRRDCANGS